MKSRIFPALRALLLARRRYHTGMIPDSSSRSLLTLLKGAPSTCCKDAYLYLVPPPPLQGVPFEQRLRCFAFLPQRINPLETEHVSIYIAPELPDVSAAASCFATRLNDTEPISPCDRCLRRCSSRRNTIVGSSRLAGDRR